MCEKKNPYNIMIEYCEMVSAGVVPIVLYCNTIAKYCNTLVSQHYKIIQLVLQNLKVLQYLLQNFQVLQ